MRVGGVVGVGWVGAVGFFLFGSKPEPDLVGGGKTIDVLEGGVTGVQGGDAC